MDSRTDLQRLLEDMDKMIRRKQQELAELDERLETARINLSEQEARELLKRTDGSGADGEHLLDDPNGVTDQKERQAELQEYLAEQRRHYESQIARLTDECVELEANNRNLAKLNAQLRLECNSSRSLAEQLKGKLQALNESLDELQSANFELNIRLARAESESQMQQNLLKKSHQQDQVLMDAFNNKLESLKEAIAIRDEEIGRLRLDNQLALDSLGIRIELEGDDEDDEAGKQLEEPANKLAEFHAQTGDGLIDSNNKRRIIHISKLIRDKDAQIEMLKEQLIQMTRELESNTNLLTQLTSERQADVAGTTEFVGGRQNDDKLESQAAVISKCQMLEQELEVKDKQMNRIEWRNRHLELLLPSKVVELIERLRLQVLKWQTDRDDLKVDLNDENNNNSNNIGKRLMDELAEQLNELSCRFESSQSLLDSVEQLQLMIKNKDGQIRRLVRELNKLNANINHDQIDFSLVDQELLLLPLPPPPPPPPPPPSLSMSSESGKVDHQQDGRICEPEAQSPNMVREAASEQPASLGSVSQFEIDDQAPAGELACIVTPESQTSGDNRPLAGHHAEDLHLKQQQSTRAKRHSIRRRQQLTLTKKRLHIAPRRWPATPNAISKFVLTNLSPVRRTEGRSETQSGGQSDGPPDESSTMLVKEQTRNSEPESALHLRNRLRQLENENQLLELAMNEILLAIKWSDGRCNTLLIDCPSLERLCLLIEARFVAAAAAVHEEPSRGDQPSHHGQSSGDLFQFVVLKSELDLLRGQNEQLRCDLKLQRRECQEHLSVQLRETSTKAPEQVGPIVREPTLDEIRAAIHEELEMSPQKKPTAKCHKCPRLIKLARHLLECIVRIESRVNASDESYINRLITLYQLTQRLSNDLTQRENLISRYQRDNHLINQQKSLAESRLSCVQDQLEAHARVCPTMGQQLALPMRARNQLMTFNYRRGDEKQAHSISDELPTNNVHLYEISEYEQQQQQKRKQKQTFISADRSKSQIEIAAGLLMRAQDNKHSRREQDEQSERYKQGERNKKVTIALLQSIISCLQARLDYKDERLNQLELMMTGEPADGG